MTSMMDVADNDNDPNPPNSSFSHGTHCSGTAAAATNNGTGVASIGYNCKLCPPRRHAVIATTNS